MNNDLISREALKKALHDRYAHWGDLSKYKISMSSMFQTLSNLIDHAPTVEPFERIGAICNENCGIYRPQGDLAEKLNERIEESVCKYCQMNKHCELCEISKVFQIITLTAEEMRGGAE